MITLYKDGGVKHLEDGSSLLPRLKEDGWKMDGEQDDLDIEALKAQADELGIKYHHKSKAETIAKLIEDAK